ncbi:hypothetical protein [Virgibacillus proomii]|uniref:hypothetical protein n=1 Tax=Virgibacillus proomii TaxID=84407 RepID=UPI001C0F7F36|nr:hypothetical protein [Virgibacillus proomii]MBU5266710.1 hypothetical protein [Virgibacillus proomii]
MGEWIKNRYADKPFVDADVASYMRAWIETRTYIRLQTCSQQSYPTWVRVNMPSYN